MKYKLGEKHSYCALYRVVYLRDIPRYKVKSGDIGGWIEGEHNLSQNGDCVVLNEAKVYDSVQISGNASVSDSASIFGNALINGNSKVSGKSQIFGNAQISDNAWVYGSARIFGNAKIKANMRINSGHHGVAPTLINRLRSIVK